MCRRPSKLNIVEEQTIADITWNEIENKLSGSLGSTFLSKREAALFQFFFLNYQHTIPRASIIFRVWGIESEVEDGNIDNYIHFLRKKLKEVGSCLKIVTIRGVGYRLE